MRQLVAWSMPLALVLAFAPAVFGAPPLIERISVNGQVRWEKGRSGGVNRTEGRPGDTVVVEGRNFGPDAVTNLSQVTINRAAPLKQDIEFHRHRIDLLTFKQYADHTTVQDAEPKELISWTDTRIEFRVPLYATTGDLVVTVQPVFGIRKSAVTGKDLTYEPEYVVRGRSGKAALPPIVVREVGVPVDSESVPFRVLGQEDNIRKGRDIFYFWPQYSQLAYALTNAGKLEELLERRFRDIDKLPATLAEMGWYHFTNDGPGARQYKGRLNPDIGPTPPSQPIEFANSYRSIVFPLLQSAPDVLPRVTIKSEATDWVGIVTTEFPNALDGGMGKAAGITCATCHVAQIAYPSKEKGRWITELVPGISNTKMDFHRAFQHVAPNMAGGQDRRRIVQAYGRGVLDFTSSHEDDGIFNPVAIGSHFGREALQRLSTAGLEGSIHHRNNMAYIHHGGIGRPTLEQSVALQTYLNSIQQDGERIRRIGLYNHLHEGAEAGKTDFRAGLEPSRFLLDDFLAVKADDYPAKFPKFSAELEGGRQVFLRNCASCHTPSLGLYTSQKIVPFTKIGTYLPPSDRMLKTEGIRVAPLTHLHFRGQGGYLHDNHIRSLDDLLNPDRGEAGSKLYDRHYAVNDDTRGIKATTPQQKKSADQLNYFAAATGEFYRIYSYDLLRQRFGIAEYGKHVELPPVPHAYFIGDERDRARLVLFLNSL